MHSPTRLSPTARHWHAIYLNLAHGWNTCASLWSFPWPRQWFGWYGFNAGSELDVDAITAQAFINTDVAASFAAITWLAIEWSLVKKPKFVGLLTGAVAGLATITPAAGYVSLSSAVTIGIAAGGVCYLAVHLKNKMGWDDALDVWGVHGIGGCLGTICWACLHRRL